MIGSSFMEEFDSEMCGDFFDHIDDLLDFSNDDLEPVVGDGLEDWPSADVFAAAASTLSEYSTEEQLPGVLSVPCDDMAELEWLSNFVDDSFSAGDTEPNHGKDSQFRTSSPVSVLERSSCSGKTFPLCPETNFPGRARTKRPRPASFSGRSVPIISPTCSETGWTLPVLGRHRSPSPANSDHFVESQPPKKITKSGTGKKKRKLLENQPPLPVRKCLHCEIQKTPQWRTGPMGPKTLCNACGVRYKSGRLFPEYRPAASPTFLATKHSNSHKKVIEMRVKLGKRSVGPEPVPESNRLLEFSVSESEFMLQCAPMVSYV